MDVETPGLPPSAPDPPRRRTRWLLVTAVVMGAAVVIVGIVLTVVGANRAFDAAASGLRSASRDAFVVEESLRESSDETADAAAAAQQIVAVTGDDLADVAARAAVADAAEASAVVAGEAAALLAAAAPVEMRAKGLWPWELRAAADRMDLDARALEERSRDADAVEESLTAADATLLAAAESLYASVPPAAAGLEAANASAVALVVLDFRDAADAVAGQDFVGSGAVTAFTSYAALAANLKQSQQSELAQKSGSLLDTRLQIEEYARSIAGGVVLDFDWAPLVNGLGGDWGLSGTATWNTARGGFSTITLSDSIAEAWPSADSRAIVTHEVGHAITSKCSGMFDSQSGPANEEWATAWAISMGHTAEGNGVQAYGYPSQVMIDAAATCR